jgi:signal transduction histidine kinase
VTVAARRSLRPNELIVDALIAGALTSLSLVAIVSGAPDAGRRDPWSFGLLLLQTVPLVARRIAPLPILVITFGATLLHVISAFGAGSLNESLGSLVALYTVAERCDRRVSIPAASVVGACFAGVFVMAGVLPQAIGGLLQTELSVALGWAVGDVARTRGLVARLLADRERMRDAEREERAARAIQLERDRIARELHDVVTHHVSVVVIQSAAAQRALDRRPEQVRDALVAIEATGREALADMRRMLGILGEPRNARAPAETIAAGSDTGALEPMPGVDRLSPSSLRSRSSSRSPSRPRRPSAARRPWPGSPSRSSWRRP